MVMEPARVLACPRPPATSPSIRATLQPASTAPEAVVEILGVTSEGFVEPPDLLGAFAPDDQTRPGHPRLRDDRQRSGSTWHGDTPDVGQLDAHDSDTRLGVHDREHDPQGIRRQHQIVASDNAIVAVRGCQPPIDRQVCASREPQIRSGLDDRRSVDRQIGHPTVVDDHDVDIRGVALDEGAYGHFAPVGCVPVNDADRQRCWSVVSLAGWPVQRRRSRAERGRFACHPTMDRTFHAFVLSFVG